LDEQAEDVEGGVLVISNRYEKYKDLTGLKVGKLYVVDYYKTDKDRCAIWMCLCECGRVTLKRAKILTHSNTVSCGKCSRNTFYEHPGGYMVGVTSKGGEFYFDKNDYKLVKQYTWYINKGGYTTNKLSARAMFLHRLVMNPPDNMCVDHIDHNKVDNRKDNLRICTSLQNNFNSRCKSELTSKYKGGMLL
jgi:hypothetical protein